MQDKKQATNRPRTDKRNTGGLPVARDATQLSEARGRAENAVDRDEDLRAGTQDQERSTPPAER